MAELTPLITAWIRFAEEDWDDAQILARSGGKLRSIHHRCCLPCHHHTPQKVRAAAASSPPLSTNRQQHLKQQQRRLALALHQRKLRTHKHGKNMTEHRRDDAADDNNKTSNSNKGEEK